MIWFLLFCNVLGISDLDSFPKKMDGEKAEEQALDISDNLNDQTPLINIVDSDKLLFSVFSLLQKLGADERPEVGYHVCDNGLLSTIKMLFHFHW